MAVAAASMANDLPFVLGNFSYAPGTAALPTRPCPLLQPSAPPIAPAELTMEAHPDGGRSNSSQLLTQILQPLPDANDNAATSEDSDGSARLDSGNNAANIEMGEDGDSVADAVVAENVVSIVDGMGLDESEAAALRLAIANGDINMKGALELFRLVGVPRDGICVSGVTLVCPCAVPWECLHRKAGVFYERQDGKHGLYPSSPLFSDSVCRVCLDDVGQALLSYLVAHATCTRTTGDVTFLPPALYRMTNFSNASKCAYVCPVGFNLCLIEKIPIGYVAAWCLFVKAGLGRSRAERHDCQSG